MLYIQIEPLGVCGGAAVELTQARGLFPLDLHQLGDGVGAVALREDHGQLLTDHLILQHKNTQTQGDEIEQTHGCAHAHTHTHTHTHTHKQTAD